MKTNLVELFITIVTVEASDHEMVPLDVLLHLADRSVALITSLLGALD
jgi:hypothetical protein